MLCVSQRMTVLAKWCHLNHLPLLDHPCFCQYRLELANRRRKRWVLVNRDIQRSLDLIAAVLFKLDIPNPLCGYFILICQEIRIRSLQVSKQTVDYVFAFLGSLTSCCLLRVWLPCVYYRFQILRRQTSSHFHLLPPPTELGCGRLLPA